MRTDIAYEVADFRRLEFKLGPVGIVNQDVGGLWIKSNDKFTFVDLSEDDDENSLFTDDERNGILTFDLPEGLIVLTKLGLSNYRDRVYPHLIGNPGPFETDEAVNSYFYKFLKEKE